MYSEYINCLFGLVTVIGLIIIGCMYVFNPKEIVLHKVFSILFGLAFLEMAIIGSYLIYTDFIM